MNRAKFALTAIAVLAIVGGALAFKAKTATHLYTRTANTTTCGVTLTSVTFEPGLKTLGTTYITDVPGVCPDIITYYSTL
jgi:hypothetical protein